MVNGRAAAWRDCARVARSWRCATIWAVWRNRYIVGGGRGAACSLLSALKAAVETANIAVKVGIISTNVVRLAAETTRTWRRVKELSSALVEGR